MNRQNLKQIILIQLGLLLMSLLVGSGCQQNLESKKSQPVTTESDESQNMVEDQSSLEMNEVEDLALDAEKAVDELSQLLEDISLSPGSYGFSAKTGSSTTQGLSDILGVLDQGFDKVLGFIGQLDSKLDEVRQKILAEKAKLDPLNPLHLVALLKIQELLGRLDMVEAKLDTLISEFAQRVGLVITRLEEVKAELDPLNPLHIVGWLLVDQVESKVILFKQNLEQAI
ncbi:MAG: hypothetical protein KDD35_00790 [Bdellovibrionales bacterium]|nr:hypothetical protein [Bdellovibrionales bacterium]